MPCALLVLGLASAAGAQSPDEADVEPREPERAVASPLPDFPTLHADLRLALPGEARNEVRGERSIHGLLWIPRIVFAPLRFAFWLATQPLVAISRLNDRYRLIRRFRNLLVSEDGTYGVVPNAFVETGFGLNAGLRAFHHDLFGKGESIRARAGWGGFFNQRYELSVSSGNRSSHVTVQAGVRYLVRDNDRFFGIGNGERVDPYDIALPLSPYVDDVAVLSRYRRKTLRGELALSFPLAEGIRLRPAQSWTWSRFERGPLNLDDAWIQQAYDVDQLVGFSAPQTHSITELRLIVDRREQHTFQAPRSLPTNGTFFQTWASWQHGVRADPSRFVRYGADLDGYIDLYQHSRILRIRTRFEGVAGDKDQIPFDGWALLAGPNLLRGYSRMRFRSRYAGLTTLEYRYGIAANMTAYAFTDMGIIFNRREDARPDKWRFGYGGGLMIFTKLSFLVGFQVAASSEGIFVNLSLSPYDATSEVP